MAGRLQQLSWSGSKYRKRQSHRPMAEINVTPFIDVMLVLLIVFMVTAPLLTAGVPVDLPKSNAAPLNEKDEEPLEITLNSDNKIFIGKTEVEGENLVTLLNSMTENDTERRIFIRAETTLGYGNVMEVLGDINKAGFKKVALLSVPKN